ncbi:MAG: M56 family metallopeptidase [Oscillospiraceae bacterium]|nr:M56 family metallopeptidase [Oscillospiraceae bacterium]
MSDIWGFLLQTLTASGVAVLLLAVKWMFRDKLSPRWQFAAWSVLGLLLLLPAGRGGRYTILNWPFYVEVLRSWLTGDYSVLVRVSVPVPLFPREMPHTLWDWLFAVYLAGVVFFLGRYVLSYFRLRLALKRGLPGGEDQVERVAARYGLPKCRSVKVEGLPTAFVCGLIRPVLALPAGRETEDKVILHELLHYKNRDVIWGLVICLFRCIHWCNPFLWTCADLAGNDLEALCDQRVLERLEGEDRRDYGRILLGMADEKYARAPGTSSIANGGKNIRRRIEAIARFKRYPKGMALVSVCVLLVLAAPLAAGSEAESVRYGMGTGNVAIDFAQAKMIPCTTVGGALDTYAKAVLAGRYEYRVMCAPLEEMNALAADYQAAVDSHLLNWWPDPWLDGRIRTDDGYQIHNLTQMEEDIYEGLLVLKFNSTRNGEYWDSRADQCPLAVQTLRVEKEGDRWVVIPQEDFRYLMGDQRVYGNLGLPVVEYSAQAGDFVVRILWQTTSSVDSYKTSDGLFPTTYFDREPQPNGELTTQAMSSLQVSYVGKPEDKGKYSHIGVSFNPMEENGERPRLPALLWADGYIGSSEGYEGMPLEEGWEELPPMGGCGAGYGKGTLEPPPAYAVDLYLNKEKVAELTLLPKEGVTVRDR